MVFQKFQETTHKPQDSIFQGKTPPVTPPHVPQETSLKQLSQKGAGFSTNGYPLNGWRRSSSGKSSRVWLAVAQLKVKKLKEDQRLKAMEYDLEKKRLQLEMERQLLDTCVEVEQGRIELSDGSISYCNRSSGMPSLPKQTLHETVRRFHALCDEDRPRPAPIPPLQPRKVFPSSEIHDRTVGVVNASEVQNISQVQQEATR